MPEIVETYFAEIIFFQYQAEVLSYKVRSNQFANRIKINIIQIFSAVALSTNSAVFCLLILHFEKQFLERRYQRQSTQARLVFCPVLCYCNKLAVYGGLCYNMPDCDRIGIKVNGTPFQPDYFATP